MAASDIRLEPYLKGYRVHWRDEFIGIFEKDVDGFFYYWPLKNDNGCWSDYALRSIADKLTEINKPWQNKINNDPVI